MNKLDLIKRNTQEIISEKELKELINKKKTPTAYIGYAPTGVLHIGHLMPFCKLIDLLEAGIEITLLIADLHAHLDDRKSHWDQLTSRSEVYELLFKNSIKALGGDIKKVKIVKGSTFQLKPDYFTPILKMSAEVTLARCKRAASEVVRFGNEPKLGGFIYPLMQTQDIVSLGADITFSGIDQRGIYMLSREILPEFGYKKPICIFTPLLPGLTGGKMSSSIASSKISLIDSEKEIKNKVAKAFCPAGQIKDNGVLAFFEYVIFPTLERRKKNLVIKRPEKFGGNLTFKNYLELKESFEDGLHPIDVKNVMADFLIDLLAPIRKEFSKKQDLLKKAYD
jgi:tyrosyl-tRNA synthetase